MNSNPRRPGDHYVVDLTELAARLYSGMGAEAFAALTGERTPEALLARWDRDHRGSFAETPRLHYAERALSALEASGVEPARIAAWWTTPSEALGGVTPVAALRAGRGVEVLEAAKSLS